jgi:hypothetical protein
MAVLLHLCSLPLAAAKPLKVIDIDCTDGDSINKALDKRDTELIINITGICIEDVVVRRDRVTLRGTDPALDGIRAATVDDPYGAALFIRGGRRVNVENLQLTGARSAGLLIEDVRRSTMLRNLRIEGNQEVGLRLSNSLVAGFDLSITGNGLAGVGLSETAYLRCDDCTIADNPSADQGFGVIGAAGALATLIRGSVSGGMPISVRLNAVATLTETLVTGYVALDARDNGIITAKGATIDGSIVADGGSRIELHRSQQVFNPVPGGNVISGASLLTVTDGTALVGATAFHEFSSGMLDRGSTLEDLACVGGSKAVCSADVSLWNSTCSSCS